MIKFFITRIIKWAASFDWAQFLTVVASVKEAAILYPKDPKAPKDVNDAVNLNRAIHVTDVILRKFSGTTLVAANLIREIAVLWVKRSK